MIVRVMHDRDVEAVLAIQAASPEIGRWTPQDYRSAISSPSSAWVVENDGQVVGFLLARQILDEIEILNIAVCPDFRRRRAGSLLLLEALTGAHKLGAMKAHLEVRASNTAALEFYERHNFSVKGRRPRYYSAPTEDALLFSTDLTDFPH